MWHSLRIAVLSWLAGSNQATGVKVVAIPREGGRRIFEYAALERETGFEPATSTFEPP